MVRYSTIYRVTDTNKNDKVADAACDPDALLVKSMYNMMKETSEIRTTKAKEIK